MNRTPVIAAAAVLAAGAAVMAGTTATAAPAFRVTAGQLKANQRIAVAAVRRSNEALTLLGPLRTGARAWGTTSIADGALTTAKLADGAVTDAKLSQQVRDVVGSVRRLGLVRLTNGQTQVLLTVGPLTLTARCAINQGGSDVAEILISTTQAGSAFDAYDASTNLTPATSESARQYGVARVGNDNPVPTGTPAFGQTPDGVALAPDGTNFSGQPFTGVNLAGRTGECVFGGNIVVG